MAQVIIKAVIVFTRGDIFVFGSWVCVADGAESFQRDLAPTPEKKPASTALSRNSLDDLVENFYEISL